MTLMPSIGKCPVCHRSSGEFLIRPIRLPADADRIAELEAKVRELEAERDELLDLRKLLDDVKQGTMADERIKFVHNLITDLAASRQQVARLVEALEKIKLYRAHNGDTWPADVAIEALNLGNKTELIAVASAFTSTPAPSVPEWPVLDKPAKVGAGRFHAGVSARLVVEAAQRHYEYEVTPEKEAERIARSTEALADIGEGALTMSKAPRGYTYDPCPACGGTECRPRNGVCPECRKLFDWAVAMRKSIADQDVGTYEVPSQYHWLPYISHDKAPSFDERRPIQGAFHDLALAVSAPATWCANTPRIFKPRESEYYSHCEGGTEQYRSMRNSIAAALGALFTCVRDGMNSAYEQGKVDGSNILGQLAAGELTTPEFERRAGIRKEK